MSVYLTVREKQVLAFMVEGLQHKEIGARMAISTRTVKFYAASLYRKYGVQDRCELLRTLSVSSAEQIPESQEKLTGGTMNAKQSSMLKVAWLSLGSVIFLASAPAWCHTSQEPAQTAAKKEGTARLHEVEAAPVPVDDVFLEIYENYQWTLREIERIEQAHGSVEIPISLRELRERAGAKLKRLQGWMKEHKVPETWVYNGQQRMFMPAGGEAAAGHPPGAE